MPIHLLKKEQHHRRHSLCQTSHGALVALQRCHILRVSKSSLSVPCALRYVNVQLGRRNCSVSPPQVFNLSGAGCSTRATYAITGVLVAKRALSAVTKVLITDNGRVEKLHKNAEKDMQK
jgi:hypothetical protein